MFSGISWTARRFLSLAGGDQRRKTFAIWRAVDTSGVRVERSRLRRALHVASSLVRRPDPRGPIWAVTMVKNEADIIEESIRNLIAQGVDQVIVADNGSTDATPQVLARLAEELPVHVVWDPLVAYWQGEKMSHLARAALRNGAAWVVPFDADEMWKGLDGRTVADALRSATTVKVAAEWWDFAPVDVGGSTAAERFPYREPSPHEQQKVAFRAHWLARLVIGNHDVTLPSRDIETRLRIAHYRTRSPEQVLRKASDGKAAVRAAGLLGGGLPQWFKVDGIDSALGRFDEAAVRADLVFDPSNKW